ncbi:MAG: HAD family phosphatase [Peptostreptococcaceae bacterium]|nr:HAD family phosphatase [Peptostreptococcaceae bacterium]
MEIKLIALDLDGTTLNSIGLLTQVTKEAIENVIQKNLYVVIATGRAFSALPDEILKIKGIHYLVTSNGARVFDVKEARTIYSNLIGEKEIEIIVDLLCQYDFMIEAFISGDAYVDKKIYENIETTGLTKKHSDYVLKTRKPIKNLFEFILSNKGNVENININFGKPEDKKKMVVVLEQLKNVTITSSFDYNLEIGGETTSKADAIRKISHRLGIEERNIMAFGDSPNDGAMLKAAGLSIAMGNSKDQIKEIAKFITHSNDEDGVAFAIQKFLL